MVGSIAALWVLGVLVGCLLPWTSGPGPALGALLLGVAFALVGDHLRAAGWNAVLAMAALAAGLSVGPPPAPPPIPEGLARLVGHVESVSHTTEGSVATLGVEIGERIEDGFPIPVGARVRIRDVDAPPGARLALLTRLARRRAFHNLSPHPPWPEPRPLAGTGRLPPGSAPVVLAASPPREVLHHARDAVRDALGRTLPPRSRGLARALVLGEASAVDTDARRAVAGAGLSHLLAVSGLHVAVVAGLFVSLLARALARSGTLAHPARAAALAGIPMALLFAAFAGGAPSAWRAATTAALGWSLEAAGRRPQPTAVAGAACLLLSAPSPREILAPSFLLSILATAALVTGGRRSADALPSSLRDAARAALRATLATAPLVVWCFGGVPLVGLVANVLLLPLGGVVLVPLAVVHALAATLVPPLSSLTRFAFDHAAAAFVAACEALARVPWGGALPPPSLGQGLVLTSVCAALLVLRAPRRRALLVAVACVALVVSEARLREAERPRDHLRVSILDVGQGDAALVDLPDGRTMVIDGGGGLPDPGASVLLPLLRARRRDRVDVLVLSHPHPDHYGGLHALTDALEVGEVWDSGQAEGERAILGHPGEAATWLASLRARGIRVRTAEELCRAGKRFGAARVDVLWPCPSFDAGYGPNDNSLVLRLAFGAHRFLFAGDAEAHAEASLVEGGRTLLADVLKVGHHGSRTSSHESFLARVRPRVGVVSCGADNRYGHPHAEALGRLESAGTEVLRTDLEGGVTFTSDGHALRVATWSGRDAVLSSRGAPSPGRPRAPR